MTERMTASGQQLSLVRDTEEPGDDLIAGPEVVDWQLHARVLQIGSRIVPLDTAARESLDNEFETLHLELGRPTVRRDEAAAILERICEVLTAAESIPASLCDVVTAGRLHGWRLPTAPAPFRPALP